MKNGSFKNLILGMSFWGLMAISYISSAQKFVIPVFPDTQNEVMSKAGMNMFISRFNWIVQQKDSLNIPIALHVGDIVNFDNISHWENASLGFKILDDAKIPYAVTLGNHDTEAVGEHSGSAAPGNVNQNLRKTSKFNSYFPVSRFTAQRGRYEEGKSDNAYYTFLAGGLNWLVLSLEFCARQGPVDWANKVVANYKNHNVIVLTHYHLDSDGVIAERNAGYGDLSPEEIYNQFICKHENILLVLCGHRSIGWTWRNDKGEKGNRIYQILTNYQHVDSGGGYMMKLEIDTQRNYISTKLYSPFYNEEKDDGSAFRFSRVRFIKPN